MDRFCFAECEDLPVISPVLTFISGAERVHHCLYLCSYLFNQLNDPYLSCSCHFTFILLSLCVCVCVCVCVCSVYFDVFCPFFQCFSVNVSFSDEFPLLCVRVHLPPSCLCVFCFSWLGLCLAFVVYFSIIWIWLQLSVKLIFCSSPAGLWILHLGPILFTLTLSMSISVFRDSRA